MLFSIIIMCFINAATTSVSEDLILNRARRQLLFPNSTLLQLNIGVGTPSPVKNVNINWAIQANFQLPWNRSQIPGDILTANAGYVGFSRKKREEDIGYVNDAKLYHFYKYVEDMLDSFGHNGTSCVHRTLCQLASQPLYSDDDDDLLHEVASFVFNPLNDVDEKPEKESLTYIQAYNTGIELRDCITAYDDCYISVVDLFSQLY